MAAQQCECINATNCTLKMVKMVKFYAMCILLRFLKIKKNVRQGI